jgi:RecA/RadA recombinase
MSDFLTGLGKTIGNEFAGIVEDGIVAGDVDGYIDTGSYVLNALVSGSIFGGIPNNKITAFAGESATGKTFFVLGAVQQFLNDHPDGGVIYFESESALTKSMISERGIDTKRIAMVPVATIEEFGTQAVKTLDKYLEQHESERQPILIVLDSLGMLSTVKEMTDTESGSDKRDMTRAPKIRGIFRTLTLKLGRAKVPMLITNHTYAVIGSYVPMKEMSGGSGLKYAASNILFLSKKKEKDGNEIVGNIIKVANHKSRLTKENKKVDVLLTYDEGLNRYYGLLELAEEAGIFKKVSTRYELPDGSKQFGKSINSSPEKYFTEEVLQEIEKHVGKTFLYGKPSEEELDEELAEIAELNEVVDDAEV